MAITGEHETLLLSYKALRTYVGLLGLLLPSILILGSLFLMGGDIQPTLSAYYYTPMQVVFVAILCVNSTFLVSYRGPARFDQFVSVTTGLAGYIVALVPTNQIICSGESFQKLNAFGGLYWAHLHIIAALIVFLGYAVFCLFLFPKTSTPTAEKRKRSKIHRQCGLVILAVIGLLILIAVKAPLKSCSDFIYRFDVVFWLESVAIWAMGLAWLVKGQQLIPSGLKDT